MASTNGSIGILGAGRIGQAMARTALRAGRTVVISNSRGPQTLTSVSRHSAMGTVEQASITTCPFHSRDRGGRTSSEVVADLVSPARVVKGANTLGAAVLAADPHEAGGRRVIFLSGDDVDAKSEVIALFEDAGFVAIDLGGLVSGGVMQQVGGPLAGVNLIRL